MGTPLGQQESFATPNARASIVAKAGIGIAGEPADLATCPGSNREQCNTNDIHRVCVKLLTDEAPTIWGMDVPCGCSASDRPTSSPSCIELAPFKACVKKQCNPGGVWDSVESD